jgi:hypothetical protein
MGRLPSRSSKDRDFATNARRTVERFIGEKLTGEPLDDPNEGKNPADIALGKLGGAARAEAPIACQAEGNREEGCKSAMGRLIVVLFIVQFGIVHIWQAHLIKIFLEVHIQRI